MTALLVSCDFFYSIRELLRRQPALAQQLRHGAVRDKAVFQPFIHAVECGKLGGRCGAQAIEQRLRERFFFVDKAAFFGGSQSFGRRDGG